MVERIVCEPLLLRAVCNGPLNTLSHSCTAACQQMNKSIETSSEPCYMKIKYFFQRFVRKFTFQRQLMASSEMSDCSSPWSVILMKMSWITEKKACHSWTAESMTLCRSSYTSLHVQIAIASLTHLVLRSCHTNFAWSQSVTWFSLVAWSVMANPFWCSSADFLPCLVNCDVLLAPTSIKFLTNSLKKYLIFV